MDSDDLRFTDIIILGMDKEPINFVLNDTAISNISYNASTKVGNCSILLSCWALAGSWQPWDSDSQLPLTLLSLEGHRHAGKSTTP